MATDTLRKALGIPTRADGRRELAAMREAARAHAVTCAVCDDRASVPMGHETNAAGVATYHALCPVYAGELAERYAASRELAAIAAG